MTQPRGPLDYSKPNDSLREIATRQRVIIFCILGYLMLVAGQFLVPPQFRPLLGLPALGIIITSTVFVFLLAIRLYGTGVGILMGILTLLPCIGLIILLVVNSKATTVLKSAGYKVGLLGASVPK